MSAIVCIFAYVAGSVEFSPEVLGFFFSLDSSHTVYVLRETSDVRIILSHEKGRRTDCGYRADQDPRMACHRHGLVARFFCSLAQSPSSESDHEALFGLGCASEANGDFKAKLTLNLAPFLTCVLAVPIKTPGMTRQTESRPDSEHLIALRSTVLLI